MSNVQLYYTKTGGHNWTWENSGITDKGDGETHTTKYFPWVKNSGAFQDAPAI